MGYASANHIILARDCVIRTRRSVYRSPWVSSMKIKRAESGCTSSSISQSARLLDHFLSLAKERLGKINGGANACKSSYVCNR